MTLRYVGVCRKVKRKSTSPAFKGLKVGNIMEFSVKVENHNIERYRSTAYVDCYNPQTDKHSSLSFKQLNNMLSGFEFEEIT